MILRAYLILLIYTLRINVKKASLFTFLYRPHLIRPLASSLFHFVSDSNPPVGRTVIDKECTDDPLVVRCFFRFYGLYELGRIRAPVSVNLYIHSTTLNELARISEPVRQYTTNSNIFLISPFSCSTSPKSKFCGTSSCRISSNRRPCVF